MSDVAPSAWTQVDYDEAWTPVAHRLAFRASFHEREQPAIDEPDGAVTFDLSPVFDATPGRFAAGRRAIDACALRALVWAAGDDDLLALDWQHPAYRYRPALAALDAGPLRVPVFPDGDYYLHTTADVSLGTFGHPWQRSLTVWGAPLLDTLAVELGTWLPVLRPGMG